MGEQEIAEGAVGWPRPKQPPSAARSCPWTSVLLAGQGVDELATAAAPGAGGEIRRSGVAEIAEGAEDVGAGEGGGGDGRGYGGTRRSVGARRSLGLSPRKRRPQVVLARITNDAPPHDRAHGGGRSRGGWNGRRHQFGDQSPLPEARCSAAVRLRSAGADAADAAATGDAAAADQPDAAASAATSGTRVNTCGWKQYCIAVAASGAVARFRGADRSEFAEAKQKILAGG